VGPGGHAREDRADVLVSEMLGDPADRRHGRRRMICPKCGHTWHAARPKWVGSVACSCGCRWKGQHAHRAAKIIEGHRDHGHTVTVLEPVRQVPTK
jgi:hypothetical protein